MTHQKTTDGGQTWFLLSFATLVQECKARYPISYLGVLKDINLGKTHWVEVWNGCKTGYRKYE